MCFTTASDEKFAQSFVTTTKEARLLISLIFADRFEAGHVWKSLSDSKFIEVLSTVFDEIYGIGVYVLFFQVPNRSMLWDIFGGGLEYHEPANKFCSQGPRG